jgi:peptidyl-prolyl cis-trans isomerase A (cyclophilin A)
MLTDRTMTLTNKFSRRRAGIATKDQFCHSAGMVIRFAAIAPIVALFIVGASPINAKPVRVAPLPDVVRVALNTEMGPIIVDLDAKHAPVTVTNFVRYVDQKRFDGIVFYRTMRLNWGTPPNGIIQAGPRGDPKRELPPIAHEPTSQTGIVHKAGTLSMARLAPGTARGDFTILLSDLSGFDADPARNGDKAGYAAFGHVVTGMDVVRKIYDAPLSTTMGQGIMRGQMIAKPVKILTARRIKIAPSAEPVLPVG